SGTGCCCLRASTSCTSSCALGYFTSWWTSENLRRRSDVPVARREPAARATLPCGFTLDCAGHPPPGPAPLGADDEHFGLEPEPAPDSATVADPAGPRVPGRVGCRRLPRAGRQPTRRQPGRAHPDHVRPRLRGVDLLRRRGGRRALVRALPVARSRARRRARRG